jgi:hypothetical protein
VTFFGLTGKNRKFCLGYDVTAPIDAYLAGYAVDWKP